MLILFSISCGGCSGLFFYPTRHHVISPQSLSLDYRNVDLITRDHLTIHGWLLPAQGELKGSIYFLHGNAENISTHIHSVKWLPEQGYQVLLIDYRGFGLSEGKPRLPDVLIDIETGFDWLVDIAESKPLFLLGQSLGASLGIHFAASYPPARKQLAGIVSDAAFTGYFDIVRDTASNHWLTWPFQYLFAWLMNYPHNAIDVIAGLSPIPILFFHSTDDRLIPIKHGKKLYRAANAPKQFHETTGAHIQTFKYSKNREILINFLTNLSDDQP